MTSDSHRPAPRIESTAWVAPNATIIGDVTLGPRVGIWYSAVIRADTEAIAIGADTNIQDCCVLHADPGFPLDVGERVSVGHGAILHGCRIGDEVLVGMGAIVMNGAVIGSGSIVGAGALVPEGVSVPGGSLVLGSPGRVRREVTDVERERIRDSAEAYVQHRPVSDDS